MTMKILLVLPLSTLMCCGAMRKSLLVSFTAAALAVNGTAYAVDDFITKMIRLDIVYVISSDSAQVGHPAGNDLGTFRYSN